MTSTKTTIPFTGTAEQEAELKRSLRITREKKAP